MKLIGLSSPPGLGKTPFAEALIPALKAHGARVSAIKFADEGFEIDHPGRDSQRLRVAGTFETVIASRDRWARIREFEVPVEPDLDLVMTEIADPGDRDLWVVVEGFRHMSRLKVEFWDPELCRYALYPEDAFVCAIVTDRPDTLPDPTMLPVFRRDQATELAAWLVANGHRFDYVSPYDPGPDVEPPRDPYPAAAG
jgi:molybdopterin-guanine dinucleotide biosynthesis protein B